MTEYEAGYLQALSDVQSEVEQMVQDPSTSSEGKLELLGVLWLMSDLIGARLIHQGGREAECASNEIAAERNE